MDRQIKLCTFNCTGYKSSETYIRNDLCSKFDIIALQETWLLPHELARFGLLHDDFCGFGTSSVDVGKGVLRGRPYGGLAWLWPKVLDSKIKPVLFDEDRLLGLTYRQGNFSFLMVNVYMPTQSTENRFEFSRILGKLASIVESSNDDAICLLGDWNASKDTPFFHELLDFCRERSLDLVDIANLPSDSYTYFSEAHNSTSWLDHICMSMNISSRVSRCDISYGTAVSNHFPLSCHVDWGGNSMDLNEVVNNTEVIKWSFESQDVVQNFSIKLDEALQPIKLEACQMNNCRCKDCYSNLDNYYDLLTSTIKRVGIEVFGTNKTSKFQIVPGWKEFVKSYHEQAWNAFLEWRSIGSPRSGEVADRMRATRARFKLALRECRASEARLRAEAQAEKLYQKDMKAYWSDVRRSSPTSHKVSNSLDGTEGEKDILNLWRKKYAKLFNSVDPNNKHTNLMMQIDFCDFIRVSDVAIAVKQLATGKSAGADGIPADVLRLSIPRLNIQLSMFLNACMRHCYLPSLLMRTTLVPLLKDKLKPASNSDNYRLIALASSTSKLLESILLNRYKELLTTQENQFGFKEKHSTDMCVYVLKDIINYYNAHRSPVFCCFLDIKKAFDRVNHAILFKKMLARGFPVHVVQLIAFWYSSQELQIRWGLSYSEVFHMSNGIRQGGILSPYLFNIMVDDLSIQLNRAKIGCFAGNILINHLSYADDMVLVAPSARGLQKLINICSMFASVNNIIYNTDKTKCIIFWPKVVLGTGVKFLLHDKVLDVVDEIKYLGIYINNNLSDDSEMSKRARAIYAAVNALISKCKVCEPSSKSLLFKSFCNNIYGLALWSSYRVGSLAKVKVAHNDIFRMLMQVPRYESASTLFAQHNTPNLDALSRNAMFSLMNRLLDSSNEIIKAICSSQIRIHSNIWKRWAVGLGTEWEQIMRL